MVQNSEQTAYKNSKQTAYKNSEQNRSTRTGVLHGVSEGDQLLGNLSCLLRQVQQPAQPRLLSRPTRGPHPQQHQGTLLLIQGPRNHPRAVTGWDNERE